MILTILMYIVLFAAAIILIITASPLRFGLDLSYRRAGRDHKYRLWVSYIHPLICKYELTSEDEEPLIVLFGFKKKKRADDEDDNITVSSGPVNDYARKEHGGADIDTDGNTGADTDSTANIDTDSDTAVNTDTNTNINTDTNTNINDKKTKEPGDDSNSGKKYDGDYRPKRKRVSLRSRIKRRVARIRASKLYRLASNRVFRKNLRKWFLRTLYRMLTTISFDRFVLRARAGYRDPAFLGRAYGYFIAARSALELHSHGVDLAVEPVFTEECLDIDCGVGGRTTLSIILWHMLVVALTFPYWRAYKIIKATKKAAH